MFQPRLRKRCSARREMLASSRLGSNWLASLSERTEFGPTKKCPGRTSSEGLPDKSQPTDSYHGFCNPPAQPLFSQRNICKALSSPIPSRTLTTHLRDLQTHSSKRPNSQTISTTSYKQWITHTCRRKRSGTDRRHNSCLRNSRRDSAC